MPIDDKKRIGEAAFCAKIDQLEILMKSYIETGRTVDNKPYFLAM